MTEGASPLTLTCGDLKFSAFEMGQGPVVVLLHGFPDTPATFRHQLPALAAAGYRAVAVTSCGYEPSSQPADGSYHVRNLAQDVVDWVVALGVPQAHLVGHDWGATIAYAAAALKPASFKTLTAIAVPQPARFGQLLMQDPAQLARSDYIMFFQQVGVAEAAVAANDCQYLENLWKKWSPDWAFSQAEFNAVRRHFAQPGVTTSALTYYRQALDASSAVGQMSQALFASRIEVPTLGITGAKDGCIAADLFARAMQPSDFAAGLTVRRIDGAGHFVHLEAAETVNRAIVEFMSQHER